MTDPEICVSLALSIGYKPENVRPYLASNCAQVYRSTVKNGVEFTRWYRFHYMDWVTIAPIAEEHNCFPRKYGTFWRIPFNSSIEHYDTAQKAIAMHVIEGR